MQQLADRAKQGDPDAERALLERLRVRLLIIAKRRVGVTDAEDLAQEACLTILEKYREQAVGEPFEPWALKVLRNKIGNYLSRRATRRSVMESNPSPEDRAASGAQDPLLESRILDCLRKLMRVHPRYVRVINLVHQGYAMEDICGRLKCNRAHCYVLLSRGRKQLRACLEGTAE